MTNIYHINGMTCYGCRNHVEEVLSKIEGVTDVSIDLSHEEARITMENSIPLEIFQKALKADGGTYGIQYPEDPKKTKS